MRRALRRASVLVLVLVMTMALAALPERVIPFGEARERGTALTVKARLTSWVARRDGYHLYRKGATVRLVVGVWPNLRGERVLARLEWRRSGTRWRRLDVSSTKLNRESRALFLVRGLPEGFSFRIRAKVPPTGKHGAGRSQWRYFRVG
ncbi:MAG: hypothetical protein OEV60_03740 [Actinomycetota bacterium]|nr:hypothetical protein [Actinomycetota bacterium]MDH5224221.1 hypothetical protein [Actinomycetota bacterium]MDH5312470.1 hypothetical protein [Actinomycetota bacterium]